MTHSLCSFAIETAHRTMQIIIIKDLKQMSRIYLDLRLCRSQTLDKQLQFIMH